MTIEPATVAALLTVVLPAGGIMAYVRKGSTPSAIAGSLIGALYAFAYFQLSDPSSPSYSKGLLNATAASAVLLVAGIVRLLKTKKLVPLILTLIGGASSYYFALRL